MNLYFNVKTYRNNAAFGGGRRFKIGSIKNVSFYRIFNLYF